MYKVVIAKCVDCGKTRDIMADEIKPYDQPMCDCGGVMIADRAELREDVF